MAPAKGGKKQQRSNKGYSAEQRAAYYKKMAARLQANYRKPYKYPGVGRKVGQFAGGAIGTAFGNPAIGSAIGGAVGQGAHSLMKAVTGFGDYQVTANSLVYNRDAVPEFSVSDRVTHVRHKEFVGDVRGSTAFAIQSYAINPANAMLFPWLSGISDNYEQWVCQGMIFEFKTTSATAVSSTNTALGTVILATQYNSLAPQFTNKIQMENYEYAQSVVPCDSAMHAIECDPKQTAGQGLFYVDNDGYSARADPRLYNIGTFNIATTGMQAVSTVGELWVTYDICFLKPKLQGNVSIGDHWVLDVSALTTGSPFGPVPALSTSSTSYNTVGTAQAATALKTSPWSGVSNNQAIFINPNFIGQLVFIYSIIAVAGVAYQDPLPTLFGNLTLNSSFFNVTQKSYAAAGNTQIQISFCVNCAGGVNGVIYPYITLSTGSFPAAPTAANLVIMSIPSNVNN